MTERLVQAASAAILNERPALEGETGRYVAGLTVELVIGRDGQVKDATTDFERRTTSGALLARKVAS